MQSEFFEYISSLEQRGIRGETKKYLSVQIRTYIIEDSVPSEEDTEKAIEIVQGNFSDPLPMLHLAWHNKQEGFNYDLVKYEQWIKAEKNILDLAYKGKVPESAFATAY